MGWSERGKQWRTARKREWRRLSDEEYEERFQRLCSHYHPAVAAIMAHEEPFGPGAGDRMIDDDR
jgi:hypothetical protein